MGCKDNWVPNTRQSKFPESKIKTRGLYEQRARPREARAAAAREIERARAPGRRGARARTRSQYGYLAVLTSPSESPARRARRLPCSIYLYR